MEDIMSERARREGARLKGTNPDRGPPVMEGAHQFDKGYDSDNDLFSPPDSFNDDNERGNPYMKLQNEIVNRDSKKLRRGIFTKIA
jgi:hypothetical protein